MALSTVNFHSETLRTGASINIILPERRAGLPPPKVIYLLSGGFADHTYYLRFFPIEELAKDYNVAVVAPYMSGRYLYKNILHGEQWWDYYSEELPKLIHTMFNVSTDREDNIAMGGSGGGYAALKLGLQKPETFGYAAAYAALMLGETFMARLKEADLPCYEDRRYHYGSPIPSDCDIYQVLEDAAKKDRKAKIFLACGTEDGFYRDDVIFRDKAKELGFDLTWDERPGGHTMEYSLEILPVMFKWLPLVKL